MGLVLPSCRNLIQITEPEIDSFLDSQKILNVATIGPRGWPHVVAMCYGFYDHRIAFWTYRKSQKVLNLRRDDRMTVLVESGDNYSELKGIEIEGRGTLIEDPAKVLTVGRSIFARYRDQLADSSIDAFTASAPKRLVVIVEPENIVSWDHSKLS